MTTPAPAADVASYGVSPTIAHWAGDSPSLATAAATRSGAGLLAAASSAFTTASASAVNAHPQYRSMVSTDRRPLLVAITTASPRRRTAVTNSRASGNGFNPCSAASLGEPLRLLAAEGVAVPGVGRPAQDVGHEVVAALADLDRDAVR